MTISSPVYSFKNFLTLIGCALLTVVCGSVNAAAAANLRSPKLLSDASSTRAVALESVTLKAEPFAPSSTVKFSSDTRTRICVFAMDLDLLPGEAANAFTADAQDAAGRRYLLRVEYAGQVPGFPGITMVIVRLADDMGDLGDVLLQLNLHGMGSNRVRVGIGHVGGGPADDVGAVPTPAPVTPPAGDPPLVADSYTGPATDADTVRFLEQATWGPTTSEIARVKAMGFKAFLNEQFNAPVLNPAKGSNYPDLTFPPDDNNTGCPTGSPPECTRDNYTQYQIQKSFFSNSLYGSDQLRQRVAFALHQILVVSGRDINRPSWMTVYLQALDRNAFGNFRTLLNDITLNPGMGQFLDMRLSTRTNPNENFAREIMQLFSVGVNELNLDGTPKLDSQGAVIPTYSQATVTEFTRIFTGWNFSTAISAGVTNYRDPMVPRGGTTHDVGTKQLFNFVAPANQTAQQDLNFALDNIFNHPNVGPFIGKQLIQHLVTSNPSPAYVERVARVFNNDCDALYPDSCTNARGNLRAVVQAILLDPEARGDVKTDPNYGKLREPAQYINAVLRGLDVKSLDKTSTSDGVLASRSTTDFPATLDQPVFLPATVFSYYQPDYVIPGTKALGPAFGILSTTTTLRRANFVNSMIYTGITVNVDRPRGTSVDLAPLQALAADPNQLLDRLNYLFMHGAMSASVRTSITNAINGTSSSDQLRRAQVAAYLVATSSQYDIQR